MQKYSSVLVFLFSGLLLSAQTFQNGQAARAVFGQTNFTAENPTSAQNILGGASGLAYYGGLLWVADSNRVAATPNNSRILAFPIQEIPNAHTDISVIQFNNPDCFLCGFPAVNSLGQTSYSFPAGNTTYCPTGTVTSTCFYINQTGTSGAPTPNGLANATGVATDGHYFAVADTDNNRVLLWNSVPTQLDQSADLVLGQANLSSFKANQVVDRYSLRGPQGVWIQNNHLFVADTQNHRVLIWNSWPTQNGQAADVVLGQNDFTHAYQPAVTDPPAPTSANQLLNPTSVTADASHLYVSDLGHNRVLIWNEIPTTNAQNADVVVGQPDMTQTTANNPVVCGGYAINPTTAQCQTSLNFPRFALSINNQLFIADGGNDRVLIFSQIPTGNGVPATGVLGEPDFIQDLGSSASISIASTAIDNNGAVDLLQTPQALAWDGTNLYVSDPYARRVLVYTPGDTVLAHDSVVNWASEIVRQEGIVQFSIPTNGAITAGDMASITINGTAYSYTLVKTDTVDTIAQNLVKIINGKTGGVADPNVTAIFAGTGSGSVYLSSIATDLAYDTVTLSAAPAAGAGNANLLASASGGYLSSGTASTGAAGMLVEINGTNLSDNNATATLNGTNVLSGNLGGAQVYMDGYPCPLLKVSPTQIVTIIPYSYTDRNSTSVYVRTVHNDGSVTVTNAVAVYIAPANPGIFNAPLFSGQVRPWPIAQATHQSGNATAVIDFEGTPTLGYVSSITIGGTTYQYVTTATDVTSATLVSIVQNLVNVINAANDPNVTASVGGAFNRIVLTARVAEPGGNGIAVTATSATSTTNTAVPSAFTLTAYSPSTCCQVTPNSPIQIGNPAAPGELINITAAGLGPITDPTGAAQFNLVTGVPYIGTANNTAISFVNATLGGTTAQVVNADVPAGSYGTYNVQVIIPQGQATNNATTLTIAQNAFISNTVTIPIGPAVAYTPATAVAPVTSITENVDSPAAGATMSGTFLAFGWALDSAAPLNGVTVSVDGQFLGTAAHYARPDVCAVFTTPDCPTPGPGWSLSIDTTQFPDGPHTLTISALSSSGADRTISAAFDIANSGIGALSTFHGTVDAPSVNFTFHGTVAFSGWTTDTASPITGINIYVDGMPEGPATLSARPDVCAAYPSPTCQVGWSIDFNTNLVSNGVHTLIAKATSADGHTFTTSRTFQVENFAGGSTTTVYAIDSPSVNAAPFSGTLTLGGWAGDLNTTVTSIGITIDGVAYNNAGYGIARPDVCSGIALQGCPNVGWMATLDTTQLADGGHTLGLIVNLANQQSETYTRTFQVANQATSANPVLSFIDQPSFSTTVSGTFTASGWAISETAGDPVVSVSTRVDGSSFGNATYGAARPDVCAAEPAAAAGCPNVGWSAAINSGQLGNGTHILEITSTTAAGHRASTNTSFNVNNSTNGPGRVYIESPTSSSSPFQGIALFSGWALYENGLVSSLSVTVDGVPYGTANYGTLPRADVCRVFPAGVNCPNVGWTFFVDTTKLADGTHTFGVTENNADGSYTSAESSFTVGNQAATNPLTIVIDAPSAVNNIYGTIVISGWALNTNSVISAIHLAVDGVPIGPATYGTARPDVCLAFPGTPGCPNLGWYANYNTALIPDGVHTLSVTATTSSGQSSTISQPFTVAN